MSLPARLRAFGISKALDYLERDPDANLPKLMDWLDKYTGERLASPYRELFHRAMSDPGNNWHRLIKSMYTDIDSRVLKKIFENFVIHAGLMDWPSRNAAGELGNGRAPWAVIIDPSFPCEMGCRGCGASIYGVRPYMEFDSLDEEIEARKGRGCHLFIFSGGNPLAREQETIALCNKHTDCVFAAFTPPRFITGELCADLLRVRNLFPAIQVIVFILLVAAPAFIFFTEAGGGPGAKHAPILVSLAAGLIVGALAQRTRLCMVGGIRDVVLFREPKLIMGFGAILISALVCNLILNGVTDAAFFHLGFADQPVAHTDGLWNCLGMLLVGFGCVLLGGCPLRQLVLSGEGNSDSAVTVLGLVVGAAFAHNFGLASSAAGPTGAGKLAVVIGLAAVALIGCLNTFQKKA